MFTAKESRNISYLDHMALIRPDLNYSAPLFPPSKVTAANLSAFPGQSASSYLPGPNTGQENAPDQFPKLMPQSLNILYPTENRLVHNGVTNDSLYAPQKRFLIFDQTGNQTKLFFSPSLSHQDQLFTPSTTASAKGPFIETATGVNPEFLANPIFEEKWDENHLTDGKGEDDELEDAEEIDALLNSDSDDEYEHEYDDSSDDEVASTGHTPLTIEEGCNKDKSLEETIEQDAGPNYSQKRQKLLDGNFKKSVPAICGNTYVDEIDSVKREKKAKTQQALGILESIIPVLDSKDPLSIIDRAIVYLKSMKTEAQALGLCYSGDKSVISP